MNRISLIGRLVRDIEIRTTQSGKSVANFTLAVNRTKGKDGERVADFIDCVAWAGGAEVLAKYTKKGHKIAVEGRLETRTYENTDGFKRKMYEVFVDQFEFLETKPKEATDNEEWAPSPDEIPF